MLVVEDDRGIAESLVRGLRQAGYAVEGVRTGHAALAAPSPDVVLLDLGLPDIDGGRGAPEAAGPVRCGDHRRDRPG
ncbi:response regulator [Pseudonocardia zijingensis]|uniref:response regulator n=1 Tax=Pseudonocardia zijingensis TaxID=153376 RepID=UPI0031E3709D